jgi:hypothetical protein
MQVLPQVQKKHLWTWQHQQMMQVLWQNLHKHKY